MKSKKRKSKPKAKRHHVLGKLTPEASVVMNTPIPQVAEEHVVVAVPTSIWGNIKKYMGW